MADNCPRRSHKSCDPDSCFKAKLAYWRENGAPGATFAGGRQAFHESPSIAQQERNHIAELKTAGVEFDRYSG